MRKTRLCDLLGIEYPIIQAPMVWIAGAELAAAVSNGGGLGAIGPNAGATDICDDEIEVGERLRRQIRKAKSLTTKPFAVNFAIGRGDNRKFSDRSVSIGIEEAVPVAIVSQGSPELYTRRLKAAGMRVLHVVSVPGHGQKAQEAGVDAVVTSGYEGGGHSGFEQLTTFSLIPAVADAVKIPVVAGGGIADARGFVAALALGAEGVYMGTRFIATHECAAHIDVKKAIVAANIFSTICFGHGPGRSLSRGSLNEKGSAETGSPFPQERMGMWRGLKNEFTRECHQLETSSTSVEELQHFLNSCIPGDVERSRTLAGLMDGKVAEGRIGCSQAVGLVKEITSAAEVVQTIIRDADAVLARLR